VPKRPGLVASNHQKRLIKKRIDSVKRVKSDPACKGVEQHLVGGIRMLGTRGQVIVGGC
jgi:hypothetical protein